MPGQKMRDATCDALKRIYLIIIGLAIAQALTRTFTDQNGFLRDKLFNPEHITQLLLFAAFLPTIIRFAHGSILHLTALAGKAKWQWDMVGLLSQAILFFILALTTLDISVFLGLVAGILILDTVWLCVLKHLGHSFRPIERQWICSNIVSCVLLAFLWVLHNCRNVKGLIIAALIAVILWGAAIIDYARNKDTYFPANEDQ